MAIERHHPEVNLIMQRSIPGDPQEHGNHGDQSPPNEASTMPPSPTPLAQSTPEERLEVTSDTDDIVYD